MKPTHRNTSLIQIRYRCAGAQSFEALLRAGQVQPAWTNPWCFQHVAVEQILYQRDVVQRELADEEHVEVAALGEGFEEAADSTKVDRVLDRTAPNDDPDDDGPRRSCRNLMVRP